MSLVSAQAMRAGGGGQTPAGQDFVLYGVVATLLGLGVIMVYSASIAMGDGGYRFLLKQVVNIGAGLLVMTVAMHISLAWWQRIGPLLVVLGMLVLALVLVPGLSGQINGSSRWFLLGPVAVQPSEFVKVFMVIYVAGYLTRRREQLMYFTKGILMIGAVVGVIAVLLLREPDFGSMVVITATVLGMMFLGGVRFWHFLACIGAGAAGMVVLTLISPYRMERVTSFLNPWSDPFDSGFQLVQALIAFGRGEWFGVGLGASVQKLHYLPAANTDFLLAVIGEELGFVGVALVITLFALLAWRAFAIARRADLTGNVFAARLAQGIGLLLGLQSIINMGVNLGVLPTKGLTLPFMSYGGSSMLASCLALGVLLAVDRETRPRPGGRR
jgi:cell division protein FtsW